MWPLLLGLGLLVFAVWRRRPQQRALPPGPPPRVLLGNVSDMPKTIMGMADKYHKLNVQYGWCGSSQFPESLTDTLALCR